MNKRCGKCKQVKDVSEFAVDATNGDGLQGKCRSCAKSMWIKRTYGISLDEYNEMFQKQEGKCAICGRHQSELPVSLVIDHDHETGEVRALLCNSCNRGLGYLQDDPNIVSKALAYITNS